ncbi:hypothetical protein IE53DRAFT_371162 [Violaceomyces palustris]|uniref:Uncharacterized protein n=1 Tax=Violaceomyces palustris TaxID=1673888 RepID=A0ACD0NPR7_9BASI|nr:hypothetical protein IE53DRAFT_371162 [Violaceomyces palustris]
MLSRNHSNRSLPLVLLTFLLVAKTLASANDPAEVSDEGRKPVVIQCDETNTFGADLAQKFESTCDQSWDRLWDISSKVCKDLKGYGFQQGTRTRAFIANKGCPDRGIWFGSDEFGNLWDCEEACGSVIRTCVPNHRSSSARYQPSGVGFTNDFRSSVQVIRYGMPDCLPVGTWPELPYSQYKDEAFVPQSRSDGESLCGEQTPTRRGLDSEGGKGHKAIRTIYHPDVDLIATYF